MAKRTAAQSEKFSKVMREGYAGKLHSGSKEGPVVTNPAQMKAIAASESGTSRSKRRGKGRSKSRGGRR